MDSIMLEREGKKPETYSKDNKAYMNMLNRLHIAAKEGKFTISNKINTYTFLSFGALCTI
jgi:hypothetical protein